MLDKNFVYALVGASNNTEKYGNKIFNDLIGGGYNVIPINPNPDASGEVEGQTAYPTLSDYKGQIDVVIFVVPPVVTEKILEEVKKLEIENVWMQPGASSENAIKYCEENDINYIHDACVMIQRKLEN